MPYRRRLDLSIWMKIRAWAQFIVVALSADEPFKGMPLERRVYPTRKRLPITPDILMALKRVWESLPDQYNAVTFWAASCICFFGFLRVGESITPSTSGYDPASHPCIGDVRVDNYTRPQFLEAKASKTDPFCQGIQVYLSTTSSSLYPSYTTWFAVVLHLDLSLYYLMEVFSPGKGLSGQFGKLYYQWA